MAVQSPINQHFFQPLLPGFHTHLDIPVAFFSKHVQGRNEHIKTAKLRSEVSDETWLVKMDGLKLTNGWEAFAVAHDLRVGDIIVFRHEGELVFHVTALGPSCCEIQYTSSHNINDDHSHGQTNNIVTGNSSRLKKIPRKIVEYSSSDHSRFVANVTTSNLRVDRLYLPRRFVRLNGLDKMSSEKIIFRTEEGRSWNLKLNYNKAANHTFVNSGWRRFCAANGMGRGLYTFKLVRKCEPPIIRLCRAETKSSSHHYYYVGSLTCSSLNNDKLYLRRDFVIANGLDKGGREIVLRNEQGRRWTLALNHYELSNDTYIRAGWKTFCQANGIKAGDSFGFNLVKSGGKLVLSLCSADSNRGKTPLECPEDSDDVNSLSSNASSRDDCSESQDSEKEGLGDKNFSQEYLEMEKKRGCSASSSYSQDRFVTLTLTPHAVSKYKLFLPLHFTRVNGIYKPRTITLMGQDGVKQVVDLLQYTRRGVMRFGKGWRDFCEAQGIKIGESFVLELIWEEEASPVLKFCTKLNST